MNNKSSIHAASLIGGVASTGFSIGLLAAPPLTSDDARTLDPGGCQFEVEQRRFKRQTELDIVPVCNLFGDTELAVGKLRVAAGAASRIDSVMVSIKKVLMPGGIADWGVAFNAATVRTTGNASAIRQNLVTAIFSRPITANGDTLLHLNAGWINDRAAAIGVRRNRRTWAAAVERDVSARWTLVAEAYGQQSQPDTAQLGLRWWAVPGYMQFTSSLGTQRGLGREGRWLSIGVRFETAGAPQ
ncbi:MAG: hypothetical protein ABI790_14275 [Betaproteobacteria bacterium]